MMGANHQNQSPRSCLKSIVPKSSASSCSQSYNYSPSIKVAISACEVDRGLARPPMVLHAFMSSYHDLQDFSSIDFWKCQLRHTGVSFFNILVWFFEVMSVPFHLELWNDMCSVQLSVFQENDKNNNPKTLIIKGIAGSILLHFSVYPELTRMYPQSIAEDWFCPSSCGCTAHMLWEYSRMASKPKFQWMHNVYNPSTWTVEKLQWGWLIKID